MNTCRLTYQLDVVISEPIEARHPAAENCEVQGAWLEIALGEHQTKTKLAEEQRQNLERDHFIVQASNTGPQLIPVPAATEYSAMVTLSVDPVFLLINECTTVTSAMRKNARWAQSGVATILGTPAIDSSDGSLAASLGLRNRSGPGESENPIISAFARLKADLSDCDDITKVDSLELMRPFLEVVSSPSTTGVITSLALASISKFLSYELVTEKSPNIEATLSELSLAITHCRFEATDQAEDDGVLLRILSLMDQIVTGKCGRLLTDENVCEIVETCLSMACQMRRGDILRRSAELTMVRLTQYVFSRLREIEPEKREFLDDDEEIQMAEPRDTQGFQEESNEPNSNVTVTNSGTTHTHHRRRSSIPQSDEKDVPVHSKPYGLPSIKEVFRVLVSIQDPSNYHQYTDSTRVMSLKLLSIAFEVAGGDMSRHRPFLDIITGTLFKHLCQITRSDNPLVLRTALQLVVTLLNTSGEHLKLQQEFLLSYLLSSLCLFTDIPREPGVDSIFYDGVPNVPKMVKIPKAYLASTPGTPVGGRSATPSGQRQPTPYATLLSMRGPEFREIMTEAITRMTRSPSYFTDCYVNYDCDVDRSDLCEDLVGFLCRNSYPDSAAVSTPSVPPLCLDAVLTYIQSLTRRLSESVDHKAEENVSRVLEIKARKKLVISVTEAFNTSPKEGIKMLVKEKVVEDDSPQSIARFLRESGRLNKTVLGEFLAKPSNKEIMDKFIESFDFSNKRLDEALRDFLSFFRLPGESQQISQIFEKFATQYCLGENNTNEVSNDDAAYVLSYAVIMLNTDIYNPQVKHHMTLEDFKKNLRGANDSKDFSPKYLEDIFHAIKTREIIMPDEHDNNEAFEYAWKSLLLKMPQAGDLVTSNSAAFDKYMFESTWLPVVTTLSYVFATATDDTVFARIITAFNQIAKLASHYKLEGVVDQVVKSLSKIAMLSGDLAAPSSNVVVEIEGTSITVSDFSVPFGADFKAQMASVTLFRIVKSYAESLSTGWSDVLVSLTTLHLFDLLPAKLAAEPLVAGIDGVKPRYKFKRSKAGRDVGLFSTISSYLSGYDAPQEPSDEDVDATLVAIDCVNSCGLDEILEHIGKLDGGDLAKLIESVGQTLAPIREAAPAVKDSYAIATGFLLELAIRLATRDRATADVVGPKLLETLGPFVSNWEAVPTSTLYRVISGVLRVFGRLGHVDVSHVGSIMSQIASIKTPVLQGGVKEFTPSLLALVGEDSLVRNDLIQSKDYWSLVSHLAGNSECASDVLAVVTTFVNQPDTAFTPDSFSWLVGVIGAIARGSGSVKQTPQTTQRHQTKQPASASKQAPASDQKRTEVSAVETLFGMEGIVTSFYENERSPKSQWLELWERYISELGALCSVKDGQVRSVALNSFQRAILADDVHVREGFNWDKVFNNALFPLINDLLRPEVYERDPQGMASTRSKTATFTCKTFLQYALQNQDSNEQVLERWIRILDILDRLINSGQKDSLRESVLESLKNVILVVRSSNTLTNEKFWTETWQRVDTFFPGLKQEMEVKSAETPAKDEKPSEPASVDEPELSPEDNSTQQNGTSKSDDQGATV